MESYLMPTTANHHGIFYLHPRTLRLRHAQPDSQVQGLDDGEGPRPVDDVGLLDPSG